MFAEKQQLKYGIVQGGKVHKGFTPKLLTLGGELAALEYTESLSEDVPELQRNVLSALAFTAQQITVDGIDASDFTPELLLAQLDVADYEVINTAIEDYRKKRQSGGVADPM